VLSESERRPERWFNTAGFETNTQRQLVNNVRTISTRFSGIRSDGINNWDLSVIKSVNFTESSSFNPVRVLERLQPRDFRQPEHLADEHGIRDDYVGKRLSTPDPARPQVHLLAGGKSVSVCG
jgi:hypothetical protein